ncbi:MAG TPA: hypothetical protein VJ570_15090 [Holophagaceae bacterium]|nr:hypothetical protein [Holophagaceae bacterium]
MIHPVRKIDTRIAQGLLVLLAWGCNQPDAVLRRQAEIKAETAAIQVLRAEYGLRPAPPFELSVEQPKARGPGCFRLGIREPGWELELPLEPTPVETTQEVQGNSFTWELPADRVVSPEEALEATPLLIHLRRGQDHRALLVSTVLTRRRAGERVVAATWNVVGMGILVYSAPVWLPSYMIFQPIANSDDEKKVARMVFPLPGAKAPDGCPEGQAVFRAQLEGENPSWPRLRIRFDPSRWGPCEGSTLAAVRGAFGCFQPELAQGISADPKEPAIFEVPLEEGDVQSGRCLLLVQRNCLVQPPEGALWALYFPPGASWVKAWRLFPEALRQVKCPAVSRALPAEEPSGSQPR